MKKHKMISGLRIKPGKTVERFTVPNELKDLQALVGGYIQTFGPIENDVILVCDEEGRLKGLRRSCLVDLECLRGNVLILRVDGDRFIDYKSDDLPPEVILI